MYIHLHGHSHYSLLDGIGKPSDIVTKAHELGMTAIALTDYNGLYGAIEFYQACKKKEVKPIIGVELGLVHNHTVKDKNEQAGNIVLVARNYEGYKNLLHLVSHANLEGFHMKARIDFDLLKQYAGGLVCIMGGEQSYLGHLILHNEEPKKIEETIGVLRSILGEENVYLELIAQYENKIKDLKKVNPIVKALAEKTTTPLLVNTNYHYVNIDNKEVFEVAMSIKDGKQIYSDDRRKAIGDYYIMSEEELREMMIEKNGYDAPFIDTLLTNNITLADRIDLEIPLGTILFPNYTSDPEIAQLYEENKDQLIVN